MYQEGSVVILSTDKLHGEGEDAVKLQQGVCGMVVKAKRKTDNNHQYVVDFGAYGQWYCYHNELDGDDKDGWDTEATITFDELPSPIFDSDSDTREEDDEESDTIVETHPGFATLQESHEEPACIMPSINVDADIKRRMSALEKGECYDS